ncbi:AAA family ATPase, partial [Parabacteroides distasonis]|nr:AAA family ATPase [Parabacteroides distasonis]
MKIKLLSLELKNFKGTKEQLINFGNATLIDGDNGTGKTTIEDAFFWLLFGKDSTDRKVFEVQPLDENNDIVHHLDTVVTGTLEIDGTVKVFKRTLKEKWQKKRGQAEQELTGNTTEYEIDDIPVKQKDYLSQISEIMDENNFKLLTNPLYFPNMDWKKQREILFEIIGDLSEESVINYNSKLKPLAELLSGKSIEEFNERIKATIKKLKDKVKDIPARIDENNSMICEEDFAALESEKEGIQAEINKIDEQIADLSKANEGKLKLQEQLFELKNQLSTLTNEALKNANKPLEETKEDIYKIKSELQQVEFKINSSQSSIKNTEKYINSMKEDLESTKNRKQELLNEYHKEQDIPFEFDSSLTNCPTCGREYEADKIEEIKADAEKRFNDAK